MDDLSSQFKRVVLVRSSDRQQIGELHKLTAHPSEIIQVGEHYGFGAYLDLPRPTRETGGILQGYTDILDSRDGVEYLHCSAVAAWIDLGKFVEHGRDIAEILSLAEKFGSPSRAQEWFVSQPLSDFDSKTPQQLVEEGNADAVKAHLHMLGDGGYK